MTKVLLYAQPLDTEPYVSKSALKDHEFKKSGMSIGAIGFTDVGKAVWDTIFNVYSDYDIDAIDLPFSGSQWTVRFTLSQLRLVLSRKGYKSLEGALGSFITLDLDGDKHAIGRFLKSFLKNLGRAPWEIAHKAEFKVKTGLTKADIAKDWDAYARHVAAVREVEAEDEERERRKKARASAKQVKNEPEVPPPKLEIAARSFLSFDAENLVLNIRVENCSAVSVEKVQATVKASSDTVQFGAPVKMISYLKPSESLTLAFPITSAPEASAGEVWAEIQGFGMETKLTAQTEKRKLKTELPALSSVEVTKPVWQKKVGELVRKDEVRAKVFMAASEAFDEMLSRLKESGFFIQEPEVIRTGTGYLGHLKMYAEDDGKRPFAFALDCVGNYEESKITLHFYAESAELVGALRARMMGLLAGRK